LTIIAGPSRTTLLVVFSALCLLSACAGQTQYPRNLYQQRHYVEAEDVFDRMEGDLAQLSVAERAEYGVYRGMTLLALGDLARAERWFSYATTLERAAPGALIADQKTLLQEGWQQLDAEQARLARNAPPSPPRATQAQQTILPVSTDSPGAPGQDPEVGEASSPPQVP